MVVGRLRRLVCGAPRTSMRRTGQLLRPSGNCHPGRAIRFFTLRRLMKIRASAKRRLLLKTSFGAMFPLVGCRCPLPGRPAVALQPSGQFPFKPARIAPKSIPLLFDVHAHFFNASDVPVKGYLAGPIAHEFPEALQAAVRAAAPVVEALANRIAISCADEMDKIATLLAHARGLAPGAAQQALIGLIDADITEHQQRIVAAIVSAAKDSDFGRSLDEADARYRSRRLEGQANTLTGPPISRDVDRLSRAVDRAFGSPLDGLANPDLERDDPGSIIAFIGVMLSPRHHNLRKFQHGYSVDDGAAGVDACFPSMVDFDHWLGCPDTISSKRDQMLLHEQLAVLSGGYVLPIVGYNPWTDILNNHASLALVEEAIRDRGFVGVKVYPPMGFLPLGGDPKIGGHYKFPDGEEVRKRMAALFALCEKYGVPVMSHTAHSMGRDRQHDALPGPLNWSAVARAFPNLSIHAAHFGGNHYAGDDRWPDQFVALMGRDEGKNVYADLAYRTELMGTGDDVERARKLFSGPLSKSGTELTYRRLMYGTDWHMMARMRGWAGYPHALARFVESFDADPAKPARHAVFYDTAVRCFKLRKAAPAPGQVSTTRQRLEAFYARWQVPTPPWMQTLDRL
ncbi:amidohydrolase family protein [Massilia sp. CCM 8694]|uniref:Amidohydrolase family protein n=2 Tax=Massilia genomosp. 1 TaxID=2609280 RepID=A0ABX0ML87_9BURK|nr:amidohydrolase family protein [Massilia genomosp. 1]